MSNNPDILQLNCHKQFPFSVVVACKCSGRAEECTFDPQVFLDSGNKTGSICNNCSRNTTGSKCQKCAEGFFPLSLDYQNLECRGK